MSRKTAAAVPSGPKGPETGEGCVYATAQSKVNENAAEAMAPAAPSSWKEKAAAPGDQVQGSAYGGDPGGAKQKNPPPTTGKQTDSSQGKESDAGGRHNWLPFVALYFLAMAGIFSVLLAYLAIALNRPDDATTDPGKLGRNRTVRAPLLPYTNLDTTRELKDDYATARPSTDNQGPPTNLEQVIGVLDGDHE